MDKLTLDCFLAVHQLGSFTLAAKKVHRTQSAVTQQINQLEKALGQTLFDRGRKTKLTQQGVLFLGYAQKIVQLYEEAFDRFKSPEIEGEVKIGVPEDFASLFLSDVLISFSRTHPKVFLNVDCDLTLPLLEKFKLKQLDLAIVKLSDPGEFPEGVEIWKEPLVWVGKKNILKKDQLIPLVLSPEPCVLRSRALKALHTTSLKHRILYTSPSYAGTIAALRAEIGLSVLPVTMIPPDLKKIQHPILPKLPEIHVSLLKQPHLKSSAIDSLYSFLMEKLNRN